MRELASGSRRNWAPATPRSLRVTRSRGTFRPTIFAAFCEKSRRRSDWPCPACRSVHRAWTVRSMAAERMRTKSCLSNAMERRRPAIRSRSTVPTSTNSGVARRSTIQRDRRRKRIAEPGPIPAPAAREKQALFAGLCGKPAPTKSDTARNKGTNLSTAVRPSSSRRS